METGKKSRAKIKKDTNEDSEVETEGPQEYIEREPEKISEEPKNEAKKPEEQEQETDADTKAREEERKQSVAREIQEAMQTPVENTESEQASMFKRKTEEREYTIWSLDVLLHDTFKNWYTWLVYIIEILLMGFVVFASSIPWIYKNWKTIQIGAYFTPVSTTSVSNQDFLFRFALFTFIWYAFDSMVLYLSDSFMAIMNFILLRLALAESEFIWSVVASIFGLRSNIRVALTCFCIFYLLTNMFKPFVKPKYFDVFNLQTYSALVLWYGLYCLINFLFMFFLGIFVYDIKRSSYKELIWELNFKIFLFKKMYKLGNCVTFNEDSSEIITEAPTFDPGFYLKDNDFFLNEEDARIVANNILYGLKKKNLKIEDIKEYFPDDYEKVYTYLLGHEITEETPPITASAFMNRAQELYEKRKDMQKTLIDRDYVFDMLEYLVWLVVCYLSLIILFFLFDINYNLYLFSLGSSLLTFSWVFADTIKKLFICFVFVLSIRPFNIGDKVLIDNIVLKVQRINLLHTTLLDRHKSIVYLSNELLFNKQIINYARSLNQALEIEILPTNTVKLETAKSLEEKAQEKIKETGKYFEKVRMSLKTDTKIVFMVYMKKNLQEDDLNSKRQRILMKMFDEIFSQAGVEHKNSYTFLPSF